MTPYNVLCIGISIKVLLELRPREWVELFDASNGYILELLACSVLGEGGVDLSGAEDNTFNLVGIFNRLAMLGIWENPLKVGNTNEILNVRPSDWMSEE